MTAPHIYFLRLKAFKGWSSVKRLRDVFREDHWKNSRVHYIPFVGPDYFSGLSAGIRVLFIGESHYERTILELEESRSHTVDCFEEFTDLSKSLDGDTVFFRRLGQLAALNEDPTRQQVAEAWRRLAFTNFVQTPVGRSAASRPTREMWATGEPALLEVVESLRPHVALVLSKSVWSRIRAGEIVPDEEIKFRDGKRALWSFPYSRGNVLCTWVFHPSRNHENQAARIGVLADLIAIAKRRMA